MVTDYEAVFIDFGEYIASKSQHGRADLLTKLAELAGEHKVPPGELSRLLRLYGVEVERVRSIAAHTDRDDPSPSGGDSIPGGTADPRLSSTEEVTRDGRHDGIAGRDGRAGRAAGRPQAAAAGAGSGG